MDRQNHELLLNMQLLNMGQGAKKYHMTAVSKGIFRLSFNSDVDMLNRPLMSNVENKCTKLVFFHCLSVS